MNAVLEVPNLYGLEIRSHVPGRLRLCNARPAHNLKRVLDGFVKLDIVQSYKVTCFNRSVLVRYNPRYLSRLGFVETFSDAVAAELGLDLQQTVPNKNNIVETRAAGVLEDPAWQLRSDLPGRIRIRHPAVGLYSTVAQKIELCLVNLSGVRDYSISNISTGVLVHYDPERLERRELMEELALAIGEALDSEQLQANTSLRQLCLSSTALGLSIAAVSLPVLAPVALVTTAVVSVHIFRSAFEAIAVERKVKVDILDAVVISLSLGLRYTFAAAIMVWIVDISNYLLTSSAAESRKLLTKVFGKQSRWAWQLIDGKECRVRVTELVIGDHVVVRAGEQFPVDGYVVSGCGMVDQQTLTGESVPVEKEQGEEVFAMTVVMTGKLVARVSKTGENTNAAQIVRVIQDSMAHKVQLQSRGERFADVMVLPTLGIAAAGYLLVGPNPAMAIINSDFGTGIRMAAPIALMASLSLAAKHGIVVKDSAVLERLSQMDAVIFDKTGTLTHEIPEVEKVEVIGKRFSRDQLLAYVASAEQKFTHPIAKAITAKAQAEGLTLPTVNDSNVHIGYGIEVEIDGGLLMVGSLRYMRQKQVPLPKRVLKKVEGLGAQGKSVVFAAFDNQLAGLILIQSQIRDEAAEVIAALKKRGVKHYYVISGDHDAATRAVAQRLGIENYFAEVLPEDKARYVKLLQDKGLKVAMVGDGINDSVALSQADYSISLRGAADVAVDAADIVFMDGSMKKFDLLFEISDNLKRNVERSFALILIPNILSIAGALSGVVGLGTSLLLNNGFNFIASINGMLPYYQVMEEIDAEDTSD